MNATSGLIGQTIGRYRVVEQLGRGGMAEVYKAYQPSLDRYVALKLMHAFLADDKDFIGRFEREAKNVAALHHPNIILVHDSDVHNGMPYMVMEFIDGGTLKTHLENLAAERRSLPLAEAVRIVTEVGKALAYAHRRNMIHRDVKPANVLLDASGRVILTDFGIAKILTGPSYTATGVSIGTPAYMSPEQSLGRPGDHRSDLYSLGVMLYQLATGQLPFEADTPLAVMLKHVNEPLPLPRSVRPDLSEGMERIILKALAKNPDDRFQSADELVAHLAEVELGSPAWAPAPEAPPAPPTQGVTPLPTVSPPPVVVPPAPPPAPPQPATLRVDAATTLGPAAPEVRAPAGPGRGPRPRLLLAGAGLLVVCLVVTGTFALSRVLRPQGTRSPATPSPGVTVPATASGGQMTTAPTLGPPTAVPPTAMPGGGAFTCSDPLGCVAVAPGAPMRLGYALAVSGATEAYGIDSRRGIELAIQDLGGSFLGHPIELTGEDTGCNAGGGEAAARKLAADTSLVAIVGPTCSVEAQVVSPILSEAGFTLISPSNTSPDLTDPGQRAPGYFRTAYNDLVQGPAGAEFAYRVLGARRVAVIHDNSVYTQRLAGTFAGHFISLGGQMVAEGTVDAGQTDMHPVLAEIAAQKPDLIYFPVHSPEGAHIAAETHKTPGLEQVQLMGADGLFTLALLKTARAGAVGLYFSSPQPAADSDAYATFLAQYEQRYGEKPPAPYHAHAYDAAGLIFAAVKRVAVAEPDGRLYIPRQALRDAVLNIRDYKGLTGTLTCNETIPDVRFPGDCGETGVAVYRVTSGDPATWSPGANAGANPRQVWSTLGSPAPVAAGKICVAPSGPIDDRSFNQSAWAGAQDAARKLNWEAVFIESESQQPSGYEKVLHEFEQSQCDLIVSVGFPLGDATFNAASANAKQNFQVLDFAVNSPPPNLRADLYSVDQAAFLAGYLAASATKTGKVGTFGGMQLPPVVEFMDGFALGVQYYNTVHGSGVRVLGWDPGRQSGTFGDNFTNTSDGRRLAEGLMNAGADIILPVAGHMGLGAAEIVKERGNAWVIGVDDDWRVSAPAYADVVLTSVIKRLDVSVFQAVEAAAAGRFKGGTYLGTLENGGVDITLDSPAIPDAMRSELEAVRTAIITGKLKTKP